MPRPWLVALGWLCVGGVLALSAIVLELSLNLFDWRPSWSLPAILAFCAYFAAVIASLRLHRVTTGPLPWLSAAAVTLALAGAGIVRLPAETVTAAGFLARSTPSPLAYRLSFAAATALPALLLVIRRWPRDERDAWFRRHAWRWAPPLAVAASVLLATAVAGRRANDPTPYARAGNVLAGPDPLVGVVQAMFAIVTLHAVPFPDQSGQARQSVQNFFASKEVSDPIKSEVRAACSADAARDPVRAHQCARDFLDRRRADVEGLRQRYEMAAVAAFPLAGLALTFVWRGRRPRRAVLNARATPAATAAPPDPPA